MSGMHSDLKNRQFSDTWARISPKYTLRGVSLSGSGVAGQVFEQHADNINNRVLMADLMTTYWMFIANDSRIAALCSFREVKEIWFGMKKSWSILLTILMFEAYLIFSGGSPHVAEV